MHAYYYFMTHTPIYLINLIFFTLFITFSGLNLKAENSNYFIKAANCSLMKTNFIIYFNKYILTFYTCSILKTHVED